MQKLIFLFIVIVLMGVGGIVLAREIVVPQPDHSSTVTQTSQAILAQLSARGEVNIVSTDATHHMAHDWDLVELSAQGYVNIVIDESSNVLSSCTFELQEIAAEGFVTITSCR